MNSTIKVTDNAYIEIVLPFHEVGRYHGVKSTRTPIEQGAPLHSVFYTSADCTHRWQYVPPAHG